MQTLVSTRTKTNVGIHTSESAKFIDEYAKNSYELINDGIVSSTLSKEELLSSVISISLSLPLLLSGFSLYISADLIPDFL